MSTIDRNGSTATVHVGENLVASVAEKLKPDLRGLTGDGVTQVVIDLAGVEMLDSMGIGLLIATHNTLRAGGGSLKVVGVSPEIYRLLQTMRLDRHFTVEAV